MVWGSAGVEKKGAKMIVNLDNNMSGGCTCKEKK